MHNLYNSRTTNTKAAYYWMISLILLVLIFSERTTGFSSFAPGAAFRRIVDAKRILSTIKRGGRPLFSSDWNSDNRQGSNQWRSIDEEEGSGVGSAKSNDDGDDDDDDDWQAMLQTKNDGSFWSSFEPSEEGSEDEDGENTSKKSKKAATTEEEESEAWLDVVASLSAEEVEFNLQEADRADMARQMQEWQFDADTIASTLGVATDASLEVEDEVMEGMQAYREEAFMEQVDMETVESHTQVDIDEETGEPVRAQMVYVDEHTCIGCTNCAMVAQSTFFMHSEHGRARVFQQWGDDDETIQIAIETCPVDCIHYVPYDELVSLEKDRRDQNINFKARLVSQAENGNSLSHRVGGTNGFTAPQQISGNMKARCNNCPSRGCGDCPMFGVGKNPEFERKEKERMERKERRKLQQQRESEQKLADL